MSERLSKSDWIAHGLRALADEGSKGLNVGPMAAALKVSRGSFYWHFRDIADFRAQLLQSWQEEATDKVIRDLDARDRQAGRLQGLLRNAFARRRKLDRAIRIGDPLTPRARINARHGITCCDDGKRIVRRVLVPTHDFTGATEVGSLFLSPDIRGGGFGKLLARARYMFIAQKPEVVSDRVCAEMRGWRAPE